jgi:hypothetical protein
MSSELSLNVLRGPLNTLYLLPPLQASHFLLALGPQWVTLTRVNLQSMGLQILQKQGLSVASPAVGQPELG